MKKLILILPMLALTLCCCGDDTPGADVRPLPVIEGWIDSEGYPVVMFTSSISPGDGGGSAGAMMLRWARVTVSDGITEAVLTGGPNADFFPPFRYYTFDIEGVPGRTYTVTAEYEDLRATATCVMPHPTAIDSIVMQPPADSDTLREVTLYFTAPADCPAYYNVEVRGGERRGRPYPGLLGTVEALYPGQPVSVPVMRPRNELDTVRYNPHFAVGEEIEVSLCRLQKDVYDFWRTYDNDALFGTSVFLGASAPLSTNVSGGLGVWSARGVDRRLLRIE